MVLDFFTPLFKEKVKMAILPFLCYLSPLAPNMNHHSVARVGVSFSIYQPHKVCKALYSVDEKSVG